MENRRTRGVQKPNPRLRHGGDGCGEDETLRAAAFFVDGTTALDGALAVTLI